MVEPIMYLAIGFLVSMLCGLMVMPLVHNRAVRLTIKRLEAATPLSMAEIQADKDQLRAEFAMSARRLEMSVDRLKRKTASQSAELGKKIDAINRLKVELGEKNAAIFNLEGHEKKVGEHLQSTEQELAAKAETLQSAEQTLADRQTELGRLRQELSDRSLTAESRQAELFVVRTQVERLQSRINDVEKELAATQTLLEQQRGETAAATRERDDARKHVENLSQRIVKIDSQLIDKTKDAERLGNRVRELESHLATQTRMLAEQEQENGPLRKANAAAQLSISELREEIASLNGGKSPLIDGLRNEMIAAERALRAAHDERAKLQRDINVIQQQAKSSGTVEQMENALLRERINDVAAEVAKLAMTIEGPDSPIKAILTADAAPAKTAKAVNGTAGNGAISSAGSLADRIRALQSQVSRAARRTG
jgi:chromosome segregation ATPase